MTISLIVPLHQDNQDSRRVLAHLAVLAPACEEVIAVLDGKNCQLESMARQLGFITLTLPAYSGPAKTRNAAAALAKGDILLFIDSDVLAPPNLIEQVKSTFARHPAAVAIFGSYDDAPGHAGFLSQYKNLQHHYVHQKAQESASTFWTGCGAVYKKQFQQLDGFAESFGHPCIEDVEFGIRLRNAGHTIHLEKSMQVKHLKKYNAFSLLRSDFIDRALPWSMLILQQKHMPNDLNVDRKSRLSVVAIYGFVIALLAGLVTSNASSLWLAAFCATALLLLNADFYRFLTQQRGLLFLAKSLPWHWLYFLYAGLGFACALIYFQIKRISSFRKKISDTPSYENTS